jgi:hypothetical protein
MLLFEGGKKNVDQDGDYLENQLCLQQYGNEVL